MSFKPAVAQLKTRVSTPAKRPAAPPVYHPHATPVCLQAKMAGPAQLKHHSVVPACCPPTTPKVLQKKNAIIQRAAKLSASAKDFVMPPEDKRVLPPAPPPPQAAALPAGPAAPAPVAGGGGAGAGGGGGGAAGAAPVPGAAPQPQANVQVGWLNARDMEAYFRDVWPPARLRTHLTSTGYERRFRCVCIITQGMHYNYPDQFGPHYTISSSVHGLVHVCPEFGVITVIGLPPVHNFPPEPV